MKGAIYRPTCPRGNPAIRDAWGGCICDDCRRLKSERLSKANAAKRAAAGPRRCRAGSIRIDVTGKLGCQCELCLAARRTVKARWETNHPDYKPRLDRPCPFGVIGQHTKGGQFCRCPDCKKAKSILRNASRDRNKEKAIADARRWREQNPDKLAEYNQRPETKGKVLASVRKRQLAKRFRTPAWADLDAIELIYQDAARLTAATGVKHEVDHIHPLQGRYCCGLHVAGNLQIMVMAANRGKRNACISCDPVWEAG